MFEQLFYWTGFIFWWGIAITFALAITLDLIDRWGWK